jgi:predicted acetyltransferase
MPSDRLSPADLRLRPPAEADESAVRAANVALAGDNFDFALGLAPTMEWASYLRARADEHAGRELAKGRVPSSFLLAVVDGEICGRASIRFRLNDHLLASGGHIGYCVLPRFRGRGIATEVLRQSLIIARAHGVQRALLTCDDDNVGSATVIEKCGGRLDPDWPLSTAGAHPTRRYWID